MGRKATLVAAATAALAAGANAWRVGASSRTILPLVNGRTDYWTPVPDDNSNSPGTCIAEWDVGRYVTWRSLARFWLVVPDKEGRDFGCLHSISIGNGDTQSVRG